MVPLIESLIIPQKTR